MRKRLILNALLGLSLTGVYGQSNPVSLRPDVQITALKIAPNFCSGIAFDPVSQNLHYTGLNGNIYRMFYPGPAPVTDSIIYTTVDHGIFLLKGLLFHDSTLYLIGNNDIDTSLTVGIIKKGTLQPAGTRVWTTVMETEPYQLGNGFFDHGFGGFCLNPSKDSLYFNSGSRTDHGEEQENGGLYPGLREVPLTSAIFRIPANASNLLLMNDSAMLSPYLFADGIRNTFKMEFNGRGHLIGAENSGDRDDSDEINHLKEGNHYGFPWVMGGNHNPQQFPGYNPTTDFMINQLRQSYQDGIFYDDPAFPLLPSSLVLSAAIQNQGPDADKFRDTITGIVMDASDLGITIGSFTSHRSPLGLVFDNDSLLISDLKGHGFVFSNQKQGDSLGNVAGGGFGTLLDPGEDMLEVKFNFDSITGIYSIQCNEVITGFNRPVDACMVGTKIYLLEHGRPSEPGTVYEISMPPDPSGLSEPYIANFDLHVYPNPARNSVEALLKCESDEELLVELTDAYGRKLLEIFKGKISGNSLKLKIDTSGYESGVYLIRATGKNSIVKKIIKH